MAKSGGGISTILPFPKDGGDSRPVTYPGGLSIFSKQNNIQHGHGGRNSPTVSYYSNKATSDNLEPGDVSLDISASSSPSSSRWSVFGGTSTPHSQGDQRSWTPSMAKVKDQLHRVKNSPAWMSIKFFCATMCFLITVHGALSTG